MTLISRLNFKIRRLKQVESPKSAKSKDVSIVIPVKNNQKGINTYLEHFFQTHTKESFPREIIIIDNNSIPKIHIQEEYKKNGIIRLIECEKIGPASARNKGIKIAKGNWILFNDSDCLPTESLISGYLNVLNGSVAYAGNVKSLGDDKLSQYYESQEILLPLKTSHDFVPQYLITANAFVWREAINKTGGFNENIKVASGEDVDLGLRLSQIGRLSYAFESVVFHNFDDGFSGFIKRFRRYGKGNKIVSELYKTDVKPRPFRPNEKSITNYFLAIIQYLSLTYGYYFD